MHARVPAQHRAFAQRAIEGAGEARIVRGFERIGYLTERRGQLELSARVVGEIENGALRRMSGAHTGSWPRTRAPRIKQRLPNVCQA